MTQPLPGGTPMFRETELEEWNMNASACSHCSTIVPQNQLSVCNRPGCSYAVRHDSSFESPTDFFNRQKVFCGQCSLYRGHFEHRDNMEQALPMAIVKASLIVTPRLNEEYEKAAFLNEEYLVDFVIVNDFSMRNLNIPDFHHYLVSSTSTFEWSTKKQQIENFTNLLVQNRQKGMDFVISLAKNSVDAYEELMGDTGGGVEAENQDSESAEQLTEQEIHDLRVESEAITRAMRGSSPPVEDRSPSPSSESSSPDELEPIIEDHMTEVDSDVVSDLTSSPSVEISSSPNELEPIPELTDYSDASEGSEKEVETSEGSENSEQVEDQKEEVERSEKEVEASEKSDQVEDPKVEDQLNSSSDDSIVNETVIHVEVPPIPKTEQSQFKILSVLIDEFEELVKIQKSPEEHALLRIAQRLEQLTVDEGKKKNVVKNFEMLYKCSLPKL